MRVLLDPEIFFLQKFGGISRYCAEIIDNLSNIDDVDLICPIYYSENLHLRNNKFWNVVKQILPQRIKNFLIQKSKEKFSQILQSDAFDVVVSSYYSKALLSYSGNKPLVLTVYDMIHEVFPELEPESTLVQDKRDLMNKASKIIAISQNTKGDILRFYPQIPEGKIEVVYLSHSLSDSQEVQSTNSSFQDKEYLLFVGNRGYYKNFKWFLSSVGDWLKSNQFPLICLGGGDFSLEEKELISRLGLIGLVTQKTFKDDELFGYYKQAFAFVFPSEYEGFGIPILEAMYAGCPVVLPHHTSFPEVAGEAGIYFELSKADSLIDRLNELLSDMEFRKKKIIHGKAQARLFSWEKTAQDCLKVYQAVS